MKEVLTPKITAQTKKNSGKKYVPLFFGEQDTNL